MGTRIRRDEAAPDRSAAGGPGRSAHRVACRRAARFAGHHASPGAVHRGRLAAPAPPADAWMIITRPGYGLAISPVATGTTRPATRHSTGWLRLVTTVPSRRDG